MSDVNAGWIKAFKPNPEDAKLMLACDVGDPAANVFRVHWLGAGYSSTSIDFDSKHKAEWVVIAINDAFKAGERSAFARLRRLIGVGS